MIEFNVFLEHGKVSVHICFIGTLVSCNTMYENSVCFSKTVKDFIIELIELTMYAQRCIVCLSSTPPTPPSQVYDVSGNLAANKTGKGKEKLLIN